jgi:hypothetical protein
MPTDPIDYDRRQREPLSRSCLHCGGADTLQGALHAPTSARFFPKKLRGFWKSNQYVPVACYACLTCGAVSLTVEMKDLPDLLALRDRDDAAPT